jgi:hypothetical protein
MLVPIAPECNNRPWYPTARLFRHAEARDAGKVLDRARAALDARIAPDLPGPGAIASDN